MTTDYKNYSLENLKNWLHDCLSAGEATSEEIYGAIKEVVKEENEFYRKGLQKTNKLLSLLDGNNTVFMNISNDGHFHDNMNGVSFYNYSSPKSSKEQSDTITFTKGN